MAIWLKDLILGFVSMDLLGIEDVGLSLPMFAVALALSLATLLLFGVFPSLVAAQANPAEDLKTGSRGSASGRGIRYRSALVILQVALSVILLVGSGLLIRSFATLRGVDPGFRVENLLTATVSLPSDDYQEDILRIQFFESLQDQIRALPGVETVGMIDRLPILQTAGNVAIWTPERPPETNVNTPAADRRVVLPGYFATMGIPLVEGRVLETSDVAESRPVIVLNRATAETVFPDGSALGRKVAVDVQFLGPDEPSIFEVVGVVEDHQLSSLGGAPRRAMFFAYSQQPGNTMRLAVGTATDPRSLIRPIQERIWDLDRDIVLGNAQTMGDALSDSVAGTRSITTILGLFAIVALALVVLGLYGVLAFFVTQKIHEIGIRVALGAHWGSVLRLVINRGMKLVGAGLILGTAGAIYAARMVDGMLFQISATDPITFAVVSGFFLMIALAACSLPAWKALSVDPKEALRVE
jgi:putative ABC transport system permease protein